MSTTTPHQTLHITLLLLLLPLSAHALTPAEVFERVKDSIVVVKTLDAQGAQKLQGSGVLLPNGKVATNCHVVKDGVRFQVGSGKQWLAATLYAGDSDKDICLLDAKGIGGTAAQLGKAASLKVGAPVYAVGAPQGLELSLSDGIVSQLRGGPPPFIQTTAAISHGSSGGGLFDSEARLVGFTTLYIDGGQSLNFAMPVEWLAEIKPGSKPVAKVRGQTDWLARTIALEQNKDWEGLLEWGRQWTENDPKDAVAWYVLGIAFGNLNRYTDAIDAYRQALRIDPEDALAWYNLGIAYIHLKRHTDAIDAFRQALRIDPEDADVWNNFGAAHADLNRHIDAIDAYRQALRIDPEHTKAWNNLGASYTNLNRYTDAIDAYHQALRINPEQVNAWNNLGLAYGNLKRYTDAINAFRQALRIDPEYASGWYNIGLAYANLNRHTDAIDAYHQTLRIDPKDANAWGNLAAAYALSGNRTAALEAIQTLQRLDPDEAEKLFNLIVPR